MVRVVNKADAMLTLSKRSIRSGSHLITILPFTTVIIVIRIL